MLENIRIKLKTENCSYEFERYLESDELIARLTEDGDRLTLGIAPKKELRFTQIKLTADLAVGDDSRIFVNGYQSWTDSREYAPDERTRGIDHIPSAIVKKYSFDKYGDYGFVRYEQKNGRFHGFTYAYVRDNDIFTLFGSLNERTAFTVIRINAEKGRISFSSELEGAVFGESFTALDLCVAKGSESEVFDRWFSLMDIAPPRAEPVFGYTSWYRHYQDISEEKLYHDLEAILSSPEKQDIFQIDDGYQTAVGDWLSIDREKFPNGLKPISDRIHENGMLSGLWLAPFVCEKNSDIYRNKKDRLLYDKDGRELTAGCNWSGSYVLDFFNEEVRDYLRTVFKTIYLFN